MSKLLGMSFDAAVSPLITLLRTRDQRADGARPYGWGMAWYAAADRAATVVKDPAATSDGAATLLLRDWTRCRSTLFVCHLRGAAARISQENTHPFARSHAGRDWVMTHQGQLGEGYLERLSLGERPVFQPVGRTDTEHLLCWLLQRCRELDLHRLADIGWERLHGWLQEINQLGTLNLLISDGSHLVVYQDQERHRPLHWLRRLPPHAQNTLSNEDIELDLGGARDGARTAVLVSSERLLGADDDGAEWKELRGGQMLVVCRGAVVWSGGGNTAPVAAAPFPAEAPSLQGGAAGPGESLPSAMVGRLEPLGGAGLGAGLQQVEDAPAPEANFGESQDARVYDVLHVTRYSYASPVEFSRHVLRLHPVHDRIQEVLSFDLSIEPLTAQHDHEDVFGNIATRLEIEGSAPEIAFVARSRVRVHPTPGGEFRSTHRRTIVPLSWMPWQRQMMLPYLLPEELPENQLQELFDYAMSFVERQDYDVIETLLDINQTIYRDYAYVQGVTSVETTPFDVYTSRRGVCQDFANLLICLARLLDVPARYRVGYIYTGGNYANKLQSDASHAWVEVFLPWLGWKGLDPTNGTVVDRDHVRVACGRHYRDATPTSGTIYRGGGDEKLEIEVRVIPVDLGGPLAPPAADPG